MFSVSQQCRRGLARTCGKHQHRRDEESVRDQLLRRGPHDQRSDARHEEEAFRAHRSHEQCHGSARYDMWVITNTRNGVITSPTNCEKTCLTTGVMHSGIGNQFCKL